MAFVVLGANPVTDGIIPALSGDCVINIINHIRFKCDEDPKYPLNLLIKNYASDPRFLFGYQAVECTLAVDTMYCPYIIHFPLAFYY